MPKTVYIVFEELVSAKTNKLMRLSFSGLTEIGVTGKSGWAGKTGARPLLRLVIVSLHSSAFIRGAYCTQKFWKGAGSWSFTGQVTISSALLWKHWCSYDHLKTTHHWREIYVTATKNGWEFLRLKNRASYLKQTSMLQNLPLHALRASVSNCKGN